MEKKIAQGDLIAIDFDGTIARNAYPMIIKAVEMPGAIDTIKDLKLAGYKLMLWTLREDHPNSGALFLTDAVNWLKDRGVTFDYINGGTPQKIHIDKGVVSRKPAVDIFIDDANIGGFIGWKRVREILL